MSNEIIVKKIQALFNKAASAKEINSLEEANAFAAKAHELLLKHNLDLTDLAIASKNPDSFKGWVYSEEIKYTDNQSGQAWRLQLINVLAMFNLCSFTFNRKEQYFNVYGREENVDTVVWLYNYLGVNLSKIAFKKFKELDKVSKAKYTRFRFLKDFLLGAVLGLQSQFKKQQEEHALVEKITALIKSNIEVLDKYIDKKFPNIPEASVSKNSHKAGSAYVDGFIVGENISLGAALPAAVVTKVETRLIA
jgi:hypothetical protein